MNRQVVGSDERNTERMAYLFGCMFSLAERGNREARHMLSEYRARFDDDEPCGGSLNIKGEHFSCDLARGHDGLAHSSKAAEAIWGYSELNP